MTTGMKCAAVASVLLLSAGSTAWAQNYDTNPGTQSSANTGAQSSWGQSSPGANITADTQQRIRQSLEQSGFKNVQVLPEAFLIRAQAPDGSHIAMLLSPDRMAEVVTGNANQGMQGRTNWQTGNSSGQLTSQQQAQQELSRYGYTEMRDLRPMQGWTADATKNGENVRVMLSDNGLVATFQGH